MADREPSALRQWKKRFADYKEDIIQAALLTIPLAAIGKINDALSLRLFEQPWQAIWLLVPIAAAVILLRQRVTRRTTLYPTRPLLLFLGAYILLFSVASQASFLDLSRELTVFDTPASRRWITPVSWGDWRYRLVPRKPDPRDELMVVLLEPGAGRRVVESRKELIDLIALAANYGARGVALDVYFTDPSPIDPLLCHTIESAAIPVFVGFAFERRQGRISEAGVPASLAPCLTEERLRHLAGFLDFDGVSRLMPLFFRNDPGRPSLGLAVARALAGDTPVDLPPDGLLRFVPPAEEPLTVRFADLQVNAADRDFLRNRFVLAGEGESDSFETVYGRRPGITIHSYVVHSLRQAHDLRRHSWWLGLAITLVFCYWMTIWYAHGVKLHLLLGLCLVATAVIVGVAVGSILVGPHWFDVVYPLTAVWLLLPILVGWRALLGRSLRRAPRPARAASMP